MAKLTDRQRKQIIAEYVAGGTSHRALAQKYGVTPTAIKRVLDKKECVQMCEQKKRENTLSMLAFMDSRKEKAQSLMDAILNAAEKDIRSASLRDKMGAFKILSEAFAIKQEEKTDASVTEIVIVPEDASEADDATED